MFFITSHAEATIDASLQMQLGNPSGAIMDINNHDHYLIQRSVEAIDYSDNLGEPNWASWDLTASDIGDSGRSTFLKLRSDDDQLDQSDECHHFREWPESNPAALVANQHLFPSH